MWQGRDRTDVVGRMPPQTFFISFPSLDTQMNTVESSKRHPTQTTPASTTVVTAPELEVAEIPRILPIDVRRRLKRIMKRALGLSALLGLGLVSGIKGYSMVCC
jgi:hypothetical protein